MDENGLLDKLKEAKEKAVSCLEKAIFLAARKFYPEHKDHELKNIGELEQGSWSNVLVECSCKEYLFVSRDMTQ